MKKEYSFLQLSCSVSLLFIFLLLLPACQSENNPSSPDPVFPGDGTWEVLNAQNSGTNGLPDQYVEELCFNSSGEAIFRTGYWGITCFDGTNWETYDTQPGPYYIFYCDRNDNFWVSSYNAIYTYTPGNLHQEIELGEASGIPKSNKSRIYEDADGTLWFEGAYGLQSNTNGEWADHRFYVESERNYQFSFVNFEGYTTVYDSVDFLQWNGSEWTRIEFMPGFDFTDIQQVYCDSNGNTWMYKKETAIYYHNGNFLQYLPCNTVAQHCFFEDSNGYVWVNLRNAVIRCGSDSYYFALRNNENIYYHNIDESADGEIWVSSNNGIYIVEEGNDRHLTTNGFPDNEVWGTCEMNDGSVMVATGEGLYQGVNGSWFQCLTHRFRYVADMECDNEGGVWVSTAYEYLLYYLDGQLTRFNTLMGCDLEQKPDGTMVLGNYTGVYELNNLDFTLISDHPAQSIEFYNGEILLGANYVLNLNRELFPFCNDESNRSMPAVNSEVTIFTKNMLNDNKGNLWCTSVEGISRFDGNEWTIYSDHATETVEENFNPLGTFYKHYINNEFTLPEPVSFYSSIEYPIEVDSRGWVWFAFEKEIIVYDGLEFSVMQHPELSANSEIVDIDAMQDGSIWFSTSENGVLIYRL